jgi:hypothetical protein
MVAQSDRGDVIGAPIIRPAPMAHRYRMAAMHADSELSGART